MATDPGNAPAVDSKPASEVAADLERAAATAIHVPGLPRAPRGGRPGGARRSPDRKGKVERSIGYAQETVLKGKRFETLSEVQADLDRWADTRIHGTTKRQVTAVFAEERPHLKPLAAEPFRFYQHGNRTVHLDGCVEVEAAYYGAPPGWIGARHVCSGTASMCA